MRRLALLVVTVLGLTTPLLSQEAEELRRAIVAKNRLFFYRLRPQNAAYTTASRAGCAVKPEYQPISASTTADPTATLAPATSRPMPR